MNVACKSTIRKFIVLNITAYEIQMKINIIFFTLCNNEKAPVTSSAASFEKIPLIFSSYSNNISLAT